MFNAALSGFGLGLSLIVASAQNAFVLKQGIRNQHVFWVCICCALSDAVLIVVGVGGFAALVTLYPWIDPATRYGGAIFLSVYALLSFKSAVYESSSMNYSAVEKPQSLISALLMCLAFTWLNPHVSGYRNSDRLDFDPIRKPTHIFCSRGGVRKLCVLFFFGLRLATTGAVVCQTCSMEGSEYSNWHCYAGHRSKLSIGKSALGSQW